MANLLGELLLELVRGIVARALRDVAIKVCAWLDSYAHGRITKLVVGGLLGLAAFFLFPILMGLLS